MSIYKPTLQDNPKSVLEHYITSLQSDSKITRKQALVNINKVIFEDAANKDCDLAVVFPEIYAYVLKSFSDSSEGCREVSAQIISNFISRLPLNDYYLTYILPVIVRRIGCPEIVEDSEEIRLVLIELVHQILLKYKVTHLLSPFINDFTSILTKTSADPYPKVKLEACECIILLTKVLERDFHFQSESYVKPLLSNFAHQHFRVRVGSIKAIGAVVLAGNAKCFEQSITPMAEKLFDENTQVRLQVTLEVGNWMLNYRDRYSFWHRMIPLLLTSLSDVMADVRETATKLWTDIGLQYMEENEEDLKKKADFLKDVPSHYPDVKRPNMGCRVLVQNNIGKIVPAIAKEMDGWQADARLRVAQLLCWLLLCAEEGSTQHANTVVRTLHRGASDDDPRIILEIKRAAELFGYFIAPETWWPLLEAEVDSWGALLVIANIVKGSRADQVAEKAMGELCKELVDPDRCRVRTPKYQRNLMYVAEALMILCKERCQPVFEELFIICFSVYAMPVDDQIQIMALSNLDRLRQLEGCGLSLTGLYEKHIRRVLAAITSDALTWTLLTPDRCLLEAVLTHSGKTGHSWCLSLSLIGLYEKHIRRVLAAITSDALTWTLLTPDRCLLEAVLTYSGSALGSQLHLIAPLLKECLATPKVDPEVKLKLFTVLSSVLLKRQTNFCKADSEKLEAFLKIVIEDVIMPNLVWMAGRTAEATRSAAAACLCAALQDRPGAPAERGGDGDKNVIMPNLVWMAGRTAEATRSAAAACLCAALQDRPGAPAERGGDGDKSETEVNLFPTKESLEPFVEKAVPLLVGLADDNSALTREHALRAACCLARLARRRGCFEADTLNKLYFVVLKRLDDSSDKVRSYAVQTLCILFKNRPADYNIVTYGAHVDALYSAMLIHLDDTEESFRKEMLDALLSLCDIDPKLILKKVKANIHLYRNKVAYERLSSHAEKLIQSIQE